MANVPSNLTRNDLASFLPNERAIRAFEQLLRNINSLLPDDVQTILAGIEEISITSESADARAQMAVDAIARLALIVSGLVPTDNLDPPIQIGTMGEQQADRVNIKGGSIVAALTNAQNILKNSVTLNNGAGALAGTLTNSPVTGNPTKWIPIDDNGTTRYIPAW